MIELVVFDMAGTTVYDGDAVQSSLRASLASRGIEVEPALVHVVIGLPKPVAIRMLLEKLGHQGVNPSPQNIAAIHEDFTRRMKAYYASDPAVRAVPGAASVFKALRQAGVKVALNTGFFRPIVDVLLQRLGWTVPAVIDAVVTSDEVARGRPHPDMILHLMKRLAIRDASRVAKVGDTAADLEEGSNAGCALVIGVTSGAYTRAQLQDCSHTHVVDSINDVPALLQARG